MHSVIELSTFIRAAEDLGLTEAERTFIVDLIASNPEAGDPIVGTGGCRKLRVAGQGRGKSGGYRVITFFTGPIIPAFLITVYGKGRKANLTASERNILAGLTAELVKQYSGRVVPMRRKP
ncbi:type II toxin-antitoxin system RelE/ParE family toxin [Xanthobacter autotrophicus]|uniref:type II toxin-antitoxin system RelE/ParE family toxin n=1 Tax=Xanthobacter autotrophicus TaxID=280 RepID=UPI00372C64DC